MTNPGEIVQLKIRLLGISPMIWRRVLLPVPTTLRELHGIFQVAMGWEGIHLYLFEIHTARYGSFELFAENPDVPLQQFGFRQNDKFSYVYDMGDHWHHEVRVEVFHKADNRKSYPLCIGGSGACPPEDCGGTQAFLERRDEAGGYDAWMDMDIMTDFLGKIVKANDPDRKVSDFMSDEAEAAIARMAAREPFLNTSFSRATVNKQFREGAHRQLMRQQIF